MTQAGFPTAIRQNDGATYELCISSWQNPRDSDYRRSKLVLAEDMNIKTHPPPLPPLEAVFWSDAVRTCSCCDGETHVILGGIFAPTGIQAVYFVSWTRGRRQHAPHIDLILGLWGPGSHASDRVLVTLVYRPEPQGGKFVQIDSVGRLANSPIYCGRALAANEALPPPFAGQLSLYVDAIWESEPFVNQALPESACGSGQGRG